MKQADPDPRFAPAMARASERLLEAAAMRERPAEESDPVTFSVECDACFGGTWTGNLTLEESIAKLRRHDAWHKRGARWDDRDQ